MPEGARSLFGNDASASFGIAASGVDVAGDAVTSFSGDAATAAIGL